MKEYQIITSNNLIVNENQNFLIPDTIKELKILVKSGANLTILTYNENEEITLNIDVEKDANVEVYHVIKTKTDYSINENINLLAQGATSKVMAVMLGLDNAKLNSKITIYHETKNTTSELLTYAIAKDNTFINIDNNAYIRKNAKQTNARQSAKGLSLSDNAKILVQPNLYIDEYDVMASHGVAMGSINKDDLFYLMSRGLTKEDASNIVIMGLIEPVLNSIDNEEYATKFRNNFHDNLK